MEKKGVRKLIKHFNFEYQYLVRKIRPSIVQCVPKTMSQQYSFQNDFKKAL